MARSLSAVAVRKAVTVYAWGVNRQHEEIVPGYAFISYAREDGERVDRLQSVLERAGIKVWRDTHNLWAGQDWKGEIRRAITAESLAFIACFSENTELKTKSYQNEELILAAEQMRLMPPGRVWLIPVRFAECSLPEFDLGAGRSLDSLHRVDLFDGSWDDNSARLVEAVLRILDVRPGSLNLAAMASARTPVPASTKRSADLIHSGGSYRRLKSWRWPVIIASVVSAVVVGIVIAINVVPGTPVSGPSTPPGTTGPPTASSRGNYSDCTTRHCYSIAVSPGSMSGSPYQGARATMYLTRMRSGRASPGNAAHISSSLWLIQNSAHDAFMEEGIYDGWVGADNTRTCARINSHSHCIRFIYEPGSGGSSKCINSGCAAYIIYWAVTNMSGATENTYFHVVEFTSPSPGTQLYVDDGYNVGKWVVHIMSSGLDYYGKSATNSGYQYVQEIKVGGEIDQVANAGACANTERMTFGMWVPPHNYFPFDAQAPNTARVDTSTFNGTQQLPGANPGTWIWNVPTTLNANGC